MHAQSERGRTNRFYIIWRHGLTFALAGPVIGAFFTTGIIFLPVAALYAYITSALPAFATGCCVAIASFQTKPNDLYAVAGLTGAGFAALTGFVIGIFYSAGGMMPIYAMAGAFAGPVCTWMTRRHREPVNTSAQTNTSTGR